MKKEEAGPAQESVWDYPRPPRWEKSGRHIRVVFEGQTIAETSSAKRVLETSHPPVYYIPREDVEMKYLERTSGGSYCEWKGQATYYDMRVSGRISSKAAWSYESPKRPFSAIEGHLAFYPHKMDACFVDEEEVQAQEGGFYGGWITDDIVGPFKGGPGTVGW